MPTFSELWLFKRKSGGFSDIVGIFIFVGINTKKKNVPYAKGTIEFNQF